MNEEKGQESSALDEVMVARIEIEEIGAAANEKEMTDSVSALPGVREVKIENGAMHVTYDPLATSEKKIEEAVRASGNTVKAAAADTEADGAGAGRGRGRAGGGTGRRAGAPLGGGLERRRARRRAPGGARRPGRADQPLGSAVRSERIDDSVIGSRTRITSSAPACPNAASSPARSSPEIGGVSRAVGRSPAPSPIRT